MFGATLIAGIRGMNCEHVPELRWHLDYPLATGMMHVLAIVPCTSFEQRCWP